MSSLFHLQISIYGFLICLAITIGILISLWLTKQFHILWDDFFLYFAYVFLFGLLGAKVLYLLINIRTIDWWRFISDARYFSALLSGGFVFYGGILGGMLGLFFCQKVHKIPYMKLMNIVAPTFPLMHAIGRIGCYIRGCCFGIPVNFPHFHVIYTDPTHPMHDVSLLPIQLIESACNLILSFVLFYLLLKKKKTTGIFSLYIICYAWIRFLIEFFRYDAERGLLLGLSTSQYVSMILFFISLFFFCKENHHKEKARL
ncbi:MAG: prolipoprotein diacylglyceryl transferase [Peptoniphilaceae bacterium]|nr:prolipoprotein diacylglyceryl transferase [Peptoniphilaceae bacterium]